MRGIFAFLVAGIIGELVFEGYAFVVSPELFGVVLQPAFLVAELASRHFSLQLTHGQAFMVHAAAGALLFPFTYLLWRLVSPIGSALIDGAVWGVALWAFAQGVLAPMVGREAFMGFGPYTMSSLVAHVLFMAVFAVIFDALSPRYVEDPDYNPYEE